MNEITPTLRERPRVRLMIAVWGERYIERFERYALASMLAPGNLPALAEAADTELLILTSKRDIRRFSTRPLIVEASRLCRVTFIPIDDLMVKWTYSVTLTLAFTRGVVTTGAAMTSTAFIFWNADFVMSDGTLRRVLDSIRAGRRIICTGSFRADAKAAETFLERHVGPGGKPRPIALQAREMVALALRHPHPTTLAKDMLREDMASEAPAQLFWGDYPAGVCVGRFQQIFMFCLVPTRRVERINSYCDYSFLPEFCPGEPIEVIGSSDEAFALELQDFEGEAELIGFRKPDVADVARRTAVWSTPEHREAAASPVVFRARDDAAAEQRLLEASARDHAAILARLPAAVSHAGHHYWISGVTHWLDQRRADAREAGLPDPAIPAELDLTLRPEEVRNASVARCHAEARATAPAQRQLERRLMGSTLAPSIVHPGRSFLRPLADAVRREVAAAAADPQARLLLVSGADPAMPELLAPFGERGAWLDVMHLRWWRLAGEPRFNRVVLFLELHGAGEAAGMLDRLSGALAPDARVTVALHQPAFSRGADQGAAWERHARLAVVRLEQAAGRPLEGKLLEVRGASRNRYSAAMESTRNRAMAGSVVSLALGLPRLAAAMVLEQPWRARRDGSLCGLLCNFIRPGDDGMAAAGAPVVQEATSERLQIPALP